MAKNRYGKRKIPKDLEVNSGITVKKINLDLKEMGYMIKFTGFEPKYEFPTYRIHSISAAAIPLEDNFWMVYALGDYTVEEWRREVIKRLRTQNPKDAERAVHRGGMNRMRRKQMKKQMNKEGGNK